MSNTSHTTTMPPQYYHPALHKPEITLTAFSLPMELTIFGIPVRMYQEDGLYFIQSLQWDSLIGNGKSVAEAKSDFRATLNDAYSIYADMSDADLTGDAIALRHALIRSAKLFQ